MSVMNKKQSDEVSAGKLTSNRPFTLRMGAQLVSNVGDWLYLLTLSVP